MCLKFLLLLLLFKLLCMSGTLGMSLPVIQYHITCDFRMLRQLWWKLLGCVSQLSVPEHIFSASEAVGCSSIPADQQMFKLSQSGGVSIINLCLLLGTLSIVVPWPVVAYVNNWNVLLRLSTNWRFQLELWLHCCNSPPFDTFKRTSRVSWIAGHSDCLEKNVYWSHIVN